MRLKNLMIGALLLPAMAMASEDMEIDRAICDAKALHAAQGGKPAGDGLAPELLAFLSDRLEREQGLRISPDALSSAIELSHHEKVALQNEFRAGGARLGAVKLRVSIPQPVRPSEPDVLRK